MRKSLLSLSSLLLLSAGASWAGTLQYTITVNTSSIAPGTTGSIDFELNPGPDSDQSLTATVSDFISDGAYGGTQTLTGDANGGPASLGDLLTINSTDADNDDFETFTYGNSISFVVDLSGPALDSPAGTATSPIEFAFSTYSDTAGMVPVLTNDPTGISAYIEVSPEGVVTTDAVSADATITATPEPATLWILAGALAVFGAVRYARRGSSLLQRN
jgi:hypothetical protein